MQQKEDNRSRKFKSECNMAQTRKEKNMWMSKDEKKTDSTQTLIQRIKAMKASKVKNQQKLNCKFKQRRRTCSCQGGTKDREN